MDNGRTSCIHTCIILTFSDWNRIWMNKLRGSVHPLLEHWVWRSLYHKLRTLKRSRKFIEPIVKVCIQMGWLTQGTCPKAPLTCPSSALHQTQQDLSNRISRQHPTFSMAPSHCFAGEVRGPGSTLWPPKWIRKKRIIYPSEDASSISIAFNPSFEIAPQKRLPRTGVLRPLRGCAPKTEVSKTWDHARQVYGAL